MDTDDTKSVDASNGSQRPKARQPRRMSLAKRSVIVAALVVTVLVVCIAVTIWGTRLSGHTTVLSAAETTATAQANPPTPDVQVGAVIYQNTFASNAKGWRDNEDDCFWRNDGYHVTSNSVCFAPIGSQTDVDVTVEVQQLSGPSTAPYGIVFRHDDSAGGEYQFLIDSDGKWVLYRCLSDNCIKLVDYTQNAAIHSSLITTNTLEVRAKGSHFDFFVNNARVGSFDDTNLVAGQVGLAAISNDDCVFTDLVIIRL